MKNTILITLLCIGDYSMIRDNHGYGQVQIKPIATGYITVKVRSKNKCGYGIWISKVFDVTERPDGGYRFRELD